MRTPRTTEIYKLIPKNAKNAVFIMGKNDSRTKLKKLVVERIQNERDKIERAIIIFERGISKLESKAIMASIAKRLDGKEIPDHMPEHIHLMGRAGFTRKEIHALIDYYRKETDIPVRIGEY